MKARIYSDALIPLFETQFQNGVGWSIKAQFIYFIKKIIKISGRMFVQFKAKGY